MRIILYSVLAFCLISIVEFVLKAKQNREKISVAETFVKVVQGKRNFSPGNWAVFLVGIFGVLAFLGKSVISEDIGELLSTEALTEDTTELLKASAFDPEILPNTSNIVPSTEKIYENESFGSTINKILVSKKFYATSADDKNTSTSKGTLIPDPTAERLEALFFPRHSAIDGLIYETPNHTYNQFPGKYNVNVRAKIAENELLGPQEVFEIVVYDPYQDKRITQRKVMREDFVSTGEYGVFTLPFERETLGSSVVIQIYLATSIDFWLDTIEIHDDGVQKNVDLVKDLFPDVNDVQASEGSSRFADPDEYLEGTMLFGPYDNSVRAGNYEVTFSIKSDRNDINAPIARVQTSNIEEGTDTQIIESVDIRGRDFLAPNVYQNFSLPVHKTESGTLEYRVYFYDRAKVWVDNVILTPISLGDLAQIRAEKATNQTKPDVNDLIEDELNTPKEPEVQTVIDTKSDLLLEEIPTDIENQTNLEETDITNTDIEIDAVATTPEPVQPDNEQWQAVEQTLWLLQQKLSTLENQNTALQDNNKSLQESLNTLEQVSRNPAVEEVPEKEPVPEENKQRRTYAPPARLPSDVDVPFQKY